MKITPMIKISTRSTRTYIDLGKLVKLISPTPARKPRRR